MSIAVAKGLDLSGVVGQQGTTNGVATLNGSSKVVQDPASKGLASGVASLNGSTKVVEEPASKGLASGVASLNGSIKVVEEPASKGLASGVASLNGSIKVVEEPASKGLASGVASLNGSTKVVEDPASKGLANGVASLDANIQLPASQNSPSVPRWYKFTKTYSDLGFSIMAPTNDIELTQLGAAGVIQACKIKHSVSFTGGAISAYTVSVGVSGNLTKYTDGGAFDVFQVVSGTAQRIDGFIGTENHGASTSIRLAAIAVGDNLDQAAAGSVDVWLLISTAS